MLSSLKYALDAYRMHMELPFNQTVITGKNLYDSWQRGFSLYDRVFYSQCAGYRNSSSFYLFSIAPTDIYPRYCLPKRGSGATIYAGSLKNLLTTARADGLVILAEEESVREHLSSVYFLRRMGSRCLCIERLIKGILHLR